MLQPSTNETSQPKTNVLPPLQVELSEQSFNTPHNDIEPNQLGLQSQTHQKQPPQPQLAPYMITRSQRGIIKPNPNYALTSTTNSTSIPREPHNIRAALAHPGWKTAIDEELEALHTNKTWVLVPRTSDMHVIGSKWVLDKMQIYFNVCRASMGDWISGKHSSTFIVAPN